MFKAILKDCSGEEHVSQMIWICIAFVCAVIFWGLVIKAVNGSPRAWFDKVIASWFNASSSALNGSFATAGDMSPVAY